MQTKMEILHDELSVVYHFNIEKADFRSLVDFWLSKVLVFNVLILFFDWIVFIFEMNSTNQSFEDGNEDEL